MLNGSTPRGFLRPCVLLMVREAPVHGYELLDRLGDLGFDVSNPGTVYKLLRQLESEGLVASRWEDGDRNSHHRRRSYELTEAGIAELKSQAHGLVRWQRQIESFLGRYIEAERGARRRAEARRATGRPRPTAFPIAPSEGVHEPPVPRAHVRPPQVDRPLNEAPPPG